MAWFKRKEKGITTATEQKKDIPKGLWYKSPTGKIVDSKELEKNFDCDQALLLFLLCIHFFDHLFHSVSFSSFLSFVSFVCLAETDGIYVLQQRRNLFE